MMRLVCQQSWASRQETKNCVAITVQAVGWFRSEIIKNYLPRVKVNSPICSEGSLNVTIEKQVIKLDIGWFSFTDFSLLWSLTWGCTFTLSLSLSGKANLILMTSHFDSKSGRANPCVRISVHCRQLCINAHQFDGPFTTVQFFFVFSQSIVWIMHHLAFTWKSYNRVVLTERERALQVFGNFVNFINTPGKKWQYNYIQSKQKEINFWL